jgi:SAM-dependent methyltransferase
MRAVEHRMAEALHRYPVVYRSVRRLREGIGDLLPAVEVQALGAVHRNDLMFRAGARDAVAHYGRAGSDAVLLCTDALATAGSSTPSRVLDFGCGHGRCARAFRAAWPSASITVCDVDRAAVRFCAERFRAAPLPVQPGAVDLPARAFDLVWAGSVLTHLRLDDAAPLLTAFANAVEDDGVVVVTTHGPDAVREVVDAAGLDERPEAIDRALHETGLAYRPYVHATDGGYGLAWFTTATFRDVAADAGLDVLRHAPRAWASLQDVWVLSRGRPTQ